MKEFVLPRHAYPKIPVLVRRQRLVEIADLVQTGRLVHHAQHGHEIADEKSLVCHVRRIGSRLVRLDVAAAAFLLVRPARLRMSHSIVRGLQRSDQSLDVTWIVDIIVVQVGDVLAVSRSNPRVSCAGQTLIGGVPEVEDVATPV